MENITHLWKSLVSENPMNVEISRFRRKFLSFSTHRGANTAALIAVIVAYGLLSFSILSSRGSVPPYAVILLQTCLFCILAPALLHNSIAGERERRSWDFLLVAPISHLQIVFGKFMGAVVVLGVATIAGLLPLTLAALTFDGPNDRVGVFGLVELELVSATFTMFVCALTIFFSARVKRPMAALGTVYGLLALGLMALPALLSVNIGASKILSDTVLYLHPFYADTRIIEWSSGRYNADNYGLTSGYFGIPHALIYLGFTAIAISWTAKTLVFAENDVKFLPKGNQNA